VRHAHKISRAQRTLLLLKTAYRAGQRLTAAIAVFGKSVVGVASVRRVKNTKPDRQRVRQPVRQNPKNPSAGLAVRELGRTVFLAIRVADTQARRRAKSGGAGRGSRAPMSRFKKQKDACNSLIVIGFSDIEQHSYRLSVLGSLLF
jgi:hypothetical protein